MDDSGSMLINARTNNRTSHGHVSKLNKCDENMTFENNVTYDVAGNQTHKYLASFKVVCLTNNIKYYLFS